jgi:hypothetical protein
MNSITLDGYGYMVRNPPTTPKPGSYGLIGFIEYQKIKLSSY